MSPLRLLTALACACAASVAQAQDCLPRSGGLAPIDKIGTDLIEGRDNVIRGDWRAFWCPTGKFDGGTGETWRLYVHATLDKYRTVTVDSLKSAVTAIYTAPDPVLALQAVLKAGEYIPPAGTQDRYDWERLMYVGCMEAIKFPPAQGMTVKNPCVPPTPLQNTEVWKTPLSGTFTLYTHSNGRLTAFAPGKATADSLCNCTKASVLVGTSRYCAFGTAEPAPVTYCIKK